MSGEGIVQGGVGGASTAFKMAQDMIGVVVRRKLLPKRALDPQIQESERNTGYAPWDGVA